MDVPDLIADEVLRLDTTWPSTPFRSFQYAVYAVHRSGSFRVSNISTEIGLREMRQPY